MKLVAFKEMKKIIENDNFIECTKCNSDFDKEFLGVIDEMTRSNIIECNQKKDNYLVRTDKFNIFI